MDEENPNVNQEEEEEDEAFPALGGAQDQAGPDQGERDAPPAPQRQVRFGGGFAFGNRGVQAVQRRQVEALVGDQVQRIGNAVVGGTGVPANTPVAGGVDAGQGEIGAVRGQPVQQPQATGAAVTGPGAIHAAATALRQDVRHARKASKMADHQSFHDYRQTTLTYFGRYRVTGVLDGTVQKPDHNVDPDGCDLWEDIDFFIRDTILQGVSKSDRKFINTEATGHAMWNALITHKTKRDYTNSMYIFTDLVTNKFKPGGDIEKWVEKMEDLRRQLDDLGEGMPDEFYARVLQACVMESHRDVLRTFNAQFDVAGRRPTSREVIRALRSDSEVDSRVAKSRERSKSSEGDQSEIYHFGGGKRNGGRSGRGARSQGRGGRGQGRGHGGQGDTGEGQGSDSNQSHKRKSQAGYDDKCHNCGGLGHWKGECPSAKKKKTQGGGSNANGANPAFRRFQAPSSGDNSDIMAMFVCDSPFDKRKCEWILDTGSKVHLCVNVDLLRDLDRTRGLHFTAWNGQASGTEGVGEARAQRYYNSSRGAGAS